MPRTTPPERESPDPLDDELNHRRAGEGENRLVPTAAVLVATIAYALLPEDLLFAPRYVIASVEVLLLTTLLATNPRRLVRRTHLSRTASTVLAAQWSGRTSWPSGCSCTASCA